MRSALLLLLATTCAAFYDVWDDDFDMVRFIDPPSKPLRPIEQLKLQRRSDPQWLFFVSTELVDPDTNSTIMEWEMTSHMTITPEQCSAIASIIEMLDESLQRANPAVSNITSTAVRLGAQECEDAECPCEDQPENNRRVLISHRLLEVKTRSPVENLKPPLQYPLRVASSYTKR